MRRFKGKHNLLHLAKVFDTPKGSIPTESYAVYAPEMGDWTLYVDIRGKRVSERVHTYDLHGRTCRCPIMNTSIRKCLDHQLNLALGEELERLGYK